VRSPDNGRFAGMRPGSTDVKLYNDGIRTRIVERTSRRIFRRFGRRKNARDVHAVVGGRCVGARGEEGDNVNIWTAEGTRDERKKSAGRTTREYVSREYTSTTMGERGGGEQWTCRIYPPIDDYIIYSANRRLYIGV